MKKYSDFTLSLALFDAIPVLLFSAAAIIAGYNLNSTLFLIGAVICTLSGTMKVIWKITVAATQKDLKPLNIQMRFLMPCGFLLIITGLIIDAPKINFKLISANATSMPAILFYFITITGMILMSIFAFKLDSTKAKSNWTEQITNAVAQLALLFGVIFTF